MPERFGDGVRPLAVSELDSGQVCKGLVGSVTDFGAFVNLGGVQALVSSPNLSWVHFDHPSQVVQPGQEVTVVVLDVDAERGRVAASLKDLDPDPFLDFARTMLGCSLSGSVVKLAPIGVFVELESGVTGLLPLSEVGGEGHALEVGDGVAVKVASINVQRRQVSLSLD
ncbi:S1 RNA-binding domain-containing protein [Streptomyces sp. NPDC001922]|uniref:S1 RNA-binding domain-containing protein n=1 Tax=Streptomyces sp. NPDC001922 TaxID=3364624 RepID=UPI0036CACE98